MPRKSERQMQEELRRWREQVGESRILPEVQRSAAEQRRIHKILWDALDQLTEVYNELSRSRAFQREASELLTIVERLGLWSERNFGR